VGIKEDLAESNSQFISILDSIKLISECENFDFVLSLNWFVDKVYTYISLFLERKEFSTRVLNNLHYVYPMESHLEDDRAIYIMHPMTSEERGNYFNGYVDGCENEDKYKAALDVRKIEQAYLKDPKLIEQHNDFKPLRELGFGRKQYYDILTTMFFILIPPDEFKQAKSFIPTEENEPLDFRYYLKIHGALSEDNLRARCEANMGLIQTKRNLLESEKQKYNLELENSELKTTIDRLTAENERLNQVVQLKLKPTTKNQLDAKEKQSIGKIIKVISSMANLETNTPFKAHGIMQAHADLHGLELPNKDTVAPFLKMANEEFNSN
jgi:hypothetical protein